MRNTRQAAQSALAFLKGPKGESIRYLFIGGCTTLVDYLVYFVMTVPLKLGITVSNVTSVAAAIVFAYVTNKYIVFQSRSKQPREVLREFAAFVAARLLTMALEVGGVYLFVNVLGQHSQLGKIEAIVIVIIVNYFLSKFFVFSKKSGEDPG